MPTSVTITAPSNQSSDERIDRQFEHVETEIFVELRVLPPEVLCVAEEQDVVPVAGRVRSENHGNECGDDEHSEQCDALDCGRLQVFHEFAEFVANNEVRVVRCGRKPAREQDACYGQQQKCAGAREEQEDAGFDPGRVDGSVADAVEPEQVGVEVLADARNDVEDDEEGAADNERKESPGAAEAVAAIREPECDWRWSERPAIAIKARHERSRREWAGIWRRFVTPEV